MHFQQHVEVYATLMQLDVKNEELYGCIGYVVYRMEDIKLWSHLDYGYEYPLYQMNRSNTQHE